MLRLNKNAPARQAMIYYFNDMKNGRQGPRVLISTCLSNEYHDAYGKKIDSKEVFDNMVVLAQDRNGWKQIAEKVVQTYSIIKRGLSNDRGAKAISHQSSQHTNTL